ncbi:MAG: alginate export family protein [Nitrospiraceae bacterium]|nr:alginate export family protein [Nitrospiraceae bacterium]
MRVIRRTWWANLVAYCHATAIVAGLSVVAAPAQAAFELPEGERITHVPVVARSIPNREEYELYDPKIGKNFDLNKFWIRGDLRVRPIMRNGVCFGSNIVGNGACNLPNPGTTPNGVSGKQNDFYAQQLTRLGFGYDLSPDVNFYMELQDSRTWGGNGANGKEGVQDDARNQNGSQPNAICGGNCGTLGVRAGYMLIRNIAGFQGLSMKAGRQYVVFGNQSLFGAFDWSNNGISHDGVMLQYSTKAWDSYGGWFRTSESDLGQAVPVGALNPGIGPSTVNGTGNGAGNANLDSDFFIFYNQIKSVPGFIIEPYYILYSNRYNSQDNRSQGLGTPRHSNQTRHNVGGRIEMRKGNFDAISETIYQFGQMGDAGGLNATQNEYGNSKNLHISAWATRNWIGYTHYEWAWKPRLAFNFDYASGDGRANCTLGYQTGCSTANTFENLYPTNHIHMGYMDVQGWKNMMMPSVNLQFRPSKDDHIEIWAQSFNLANTKDNWYRATQVVYVYSKADNTKRHIGDEIDFAWTHIFMDGKLSFQAVYGHMFAGAYIKENLGTSADQDWAYAQLWVNF